MTGVLIYRWTGARVGREVESMADADEVNAVFEKLEAEGVMDGFEWIHTLTGTDADMLIVRGELPALMQVALAPDMLNALNTSMYVQQDFRWDIGIAGRTADEIYPGWREMVTEARAAVHG